MWKQYPYIEHDIQKVETFVFYIFQHVLFHALEHKDENIEDVVDGDAKVLLSEVKGCKIEKQLNVLYDLFKQLNDEQIKVLQMAFTNNNQIDKLCSNEIAPFRFVDLQKKYKEDKHWKILLTKLRTFCVDMYTEHIKLKPFQDRYGTMKAYYNTLVRNDSMCHCCGIGTILTRDNTPRDAFDHYLAKSIYPFISLNFHNLIPTCPHCNSSYKQEKDALFEKVGKKEKRVKAFCPFRTGSEQNHIIVKVEFSKPYNMKDVDNCGLTFNFTCKGKEEEIQTWLRVYSIEEQYKSFCCNLGNLSLVKDLLEHCGPEILKLQIQSWERLDCLDGAFLRAAFARGVCKSLNIKI